MALLTFYGAPDLLRYRGRAGGDVTADVQNALTGAMSTPQMMTVIPTRVEEEPSIEATPVGDKGGPLPQSESVNGDLELSEEELLAQDPRVHQPAVDNRNWLQKAWDAASGSVSDVYNYFTDPQTNVLSDAYNYATDTDKGLLPDTLDFAGTVLGAPFGVASALAGTTFEHSPLKGLADTGREQGKPIYERKLVPVLDKDGNVVKDAQGNPKMQEVYDYVRNEKGEIVRDDSKVLMDDGKTWRDRNFMDTAFDVLRGVDRYIDPATKYFRKGMEQAATHPMGWSLTARDPEGPWAAAMKGAVRQRKMDLTERGQGNAINTMMYDINRHIDENYGPMTPEARENLVMELASRQLPLMKANQTQFNMATPDQIVDELTRKGLVKSADESAATSYNIIEKGAENVLEAYKPLIAQKGTNEQAVETHRMAIDNALKNPGNFASGALTGLRQFLARNGMDTNFATTDMLVKASNNLLFSKIKELVNDGALTEAEGEAIRRSIMGVSDPVQAYILQATIESIFSRRDALKGQFGETQYQYGQDVGSVTGVVESYLNKQVKDSLKELSLQANDVQVHSKYGIVVPAYKKATKSDGTTSFEPIKSENGKQIYRPYNFSHYVDSIRLPAMGEIQDEINAAIVKNKPVRREGALLW